MSWMMTFLAIIERISHSTINVALDTYDYLFPAIDERLVAAPACRFRQSQKAS